MADNHAHPNNRRRVLTIDDLSDDDLLAIFDFYAVEYQDVGFRQLGDFNTKLEIESWHSLVHVCRRWRVLVFASARRLNLQLCCITRQPQREATLDVWPAFPLYILGGVGPVDDVIAELEHSNRIRQIDLDFYSTAQIEKLGAAIMHVPFPELTFLCLSFRDLSYRPVLPDSFLGGSAPRLRSIYLTSIPFPGLPKFLLSATYLVKLWLVNIPHSGYFSPEAMATCLSVLTSLKSLKLGFQSLQSSPDQESRRPPPSARSVLPVLGSFSFRGVKEYLEELVVRIDAPQLRRLSTAFFSDIDFDAPELIQFISRTPTVGANDEARLICYGSEFLVRLRSLPGPYDLETVEVNISYQVPDRQLSSLAEICTSSLCVLLTMENLYIYGYRYSSLDWPDDIENTEWLYLLLPFTAVKNLYLSKSISSRIAPVLQELTGERTTEVLPDLQNVLLEEFRPSEPVQEGIAQFISARKLTNHPVAISVWDRDKDLVWGEP